MSRRSLHQLTGTTAVILLLVLGASPASAHVDPGQDVRTHTDPPSSCPLERVGTQFVKCDDLTGNGVPAPAYIPSR
jgi:hypothetical protein